MPPPAPLPLDRQHLTPGSRLCAAVSGGADSVALLLSLVAANRQKKEPLGVGLSVVHVHHGLRGAEADADQEFVEALCKRLDLPLHLHQADVTGRLTNTRETLEEAARFLRYRIFNELLSSGQADAVLTAHTLDDQAETVIMKLLRGAWTSGLGAIHPVLETTGIPGRILRPLLAVRRAEVEAFLRLAGEPWRDDSSNQDPAFTRNRIRHQLMPILREFNPSVDAALAATATLARDEEAHWQRTVAQLLPQLILPGSPVRGGGRAVSTLPTEASLAVEVDRLRSLDAATRRRVLRSAAEQLGVRLNFEETQRLLAVCQPKALTARLQLSHGLRAVRSVRELRLERSTS